MRPRRVKKDPCSQCKGTGLIEAWMGIRPRSIKWVCGDCNGTGKGRMQRLTTKENGR